jgi:hypothetical protein
MDPRRTLIAALAAPLVLLGACGGNDASVADPPISPGSTSSSPTTPPKRETPEHFIRRWTQVEKRMENTGDVDKYLALSRGCMACRKLAAQIRGFYDAGGYVKWGGWQISSIKVNSKQEHATTYAVRNRSLPTTYKEASGGPTKHLGGGVTTELIQVQRYGDTWNVSSKAELAS